MKRTLLSETDTSSSETDTSSPLASLPSGAARQGSFGLAALRVTLGILVLATWADNLSKDLYTADGLTGLINWLFSPDGNSSSLSAYQSLLESVVVPNAGLFGVLQLIIEFAFGVGLLLGLCTRLCSLLAAGFFVSLFLGYYGGHEWIWTYVLLTVSAIAVYLGYGGRTLGLDHYLAKARGDSPGSLIW